MPAFGRDGMLKRDEIVDVADYVRSLSGLSTAPGRSRARRENLRRATARVCHGAEGKGTVARRPQSDRPDLALRRRHERPSSRPSGTATAASCPPGAKLDPTTIKALTVYVYSLGGGEKSVPRMSGSLTQATAAQPGHVGAHRSGGGDLSARFRSRRGLALERGRGAALRGAQEDLSAACIRPVPPHQMGGAGRQPRRLLLPALVRWDRGPNAPDQAVLIDIAGAALLFLLDRDLAAGGLLPHRPS